MITGLIISLLITSAAIWPLICADLTSMDRASLCSAYRHRKTTRDVYDSIGFYQHMLYRCVFMNPFKLYIYDISEITSDSEIDDDWYFDKMEKFIGEPVTKRRNEMKNFRKVQAENEQMMIEINSSLGL